ncbi:hypothetical protein J7E70_04080 [Variovorax paradoxus]|nr:hypothetical protein [Variovorax paradoxus]MBT2299636.1 hypothetical protein [Variovorax paradoxus]
MQVRTDVYRAQGNDGQIYIVFRRTQIVSVKTPYGLVKKQREPKFYLGNGDLLECSGGYDMFKTVDGRLVLRLMPAKVGAVG